MILVKYTPLDNGSIGPNGEKELNFETHADFRDWIPTYVCGSCEQDFEMIYGEPMHAVRDWLSSGCGCEIDIVDPHDIIMWNDVVKWNKEEEFDG